MNNSLVQKQNTKLGFADFITTDKVKARITKAISGKSGERFITNITSTVSNNPVLQECDYGTIINAALLELVFKYLFGIIACAKLMSRVFIGKIVALARVFGKKLSKHNFAVAPVIGVCRVKIISPF